MSNFDIQRFIDRQKLRSLHWWVLALCSLIMFIDGLDVFMVGKIAPVIAKGFREPSSHMTGVFQLQQVGLAIGSFMATPLADRYGRKPMLVLAASIFGALTIACAFAQSLGQLAILRGVAGLFLAGAMPMAAALLAEMTPKHRRATFMAVGFASYSGGSAAGGAVAAWLINDYGWQSGFWVAGLLPLVAVPLILLLVPESLQHLAGRNPRHPAISRTLRRLDPAVVLDGTEIFLSGDGSKSADKSSILDVFRDGRARTTVLIWICSLFSMGSTALLSAWMPTFFQEMAGIPVQRFAIFALIASVGGLAGTLILGWLMDRLKPTRMISTYYAGLAISLILLGRLPFGTPLFAGVLIAWSFFQVGGQSGLNTLVTRIYPSNMRSTGLGWAGGVGRSWGVITPLFGGLALASHMSLEMTMALTGVPAIAVALVILALGSPPVAGGAVQAPMRRTG